MNNWRYSLCVVCDSDTVDLCRKAVSAGVSWITVHGRTPPQRCQPVNVDAIRIIADSVQVPVVANGDVKSVAIADDIRRQTGVTGEQLSVVSEWFEDFLFCSFLDMHFITVNFQQQ